MTSRLQFLGACGTVTGSRFLLESGSDKVLVDCGLFQGQRVLRRRNWDSLPFDPSDLGGVVLTHAHLDHSGYLPVLTRDGFHGPVLASPATCDLAALVLRDSAHLQEEDAKYAAERGFSKHEPPRPLYGEQDAEGVTLLDGTLQRGTLLISFERLHRVGRFPVRDRQVLGPIGYLKLPADAKGMRENQGIEAIAVLQGGPRKGSVVAFAERLTRGSGYHTGWIWGSGGSGEAQKFQLQDIDGFNITDAASLADGSLLVLERYFRWSEGVKMRLRHIPVSEIAPGARIAGRTLFEGDSSFEIDNMEGLAVHRAAGGETIVSMISDDNFNHLLQRTLFLQFTLLDEGPRNASRP